jgi:hypothetical protein
MNARVTLRWWELTALMILGDVVTVAFHELGHHWGWW